MLKMKLIMPHNYFLLQAGMHMSCKFPVVTIDALLTGQSVPLEGSCALSAIVKRPSSEKLFIALSGLSGDEQADRKHHGGPEKAIHHYAADHYDFWKKQEGICQDVLLSPGAFGENISTLGLTEETVCLADQWRMGTALLEVSQARQPCWKLNFRFGLPDMAEQVQRTCRTGWYYRVLSEGQVAAGDKMVLEKRPCPEWPLSRLLHLLYHDPLNKAELRKAADLSFLSANWKKIFTDRLSDGQVEDWSRRLFGPAQNNL